MDAGFHKTFEATGEIKKYRLVAFNAEGTVKQATAGTDAIIGCTLEYGANNGRVDVCLGRIPRVMAGEALNAGDKITANADGQAVKATAGDNIIGVVFAPAAADTLVDFILK